MSRIGRIFTGLFGKRVPLKTSAETVAYYQQFGFFVNRSPEAVEEMYRKEWGEHATAGKPWDDVQILRLDDAAAWSEDPEADVCEENEVYVSTLKAWAHITHGVLTITDIKEHWESETGPIEITFLLNGQSARLEPKYQDDWIDLEILIELNRLVASTGRRFNGAVDGNFCQLLFLSPEIEKRLRNERGYPFFLP